MQESSTGCCKGLIQSGNGLACIPQAVQLQLRRNNLPSDTAEMALPLHNACCSFQPAGALQPASMRAPQDYDLRFKDTHRRLHVPQGPQQRRASYLSEMTWNTAGRPLLTG